MPTGSVTSGARCKKCPGSQFATIADLRRHQWKEHRETFRNLEKAAQDANRNGATRSYRCSYCQRKFKGMAKLLKHNWRVHRGQEEKQELALREALLTPTVRLAAPNGAAPHHGEMRVSELLVELKDKQRFMNDVVDLIGAMLDRHREGQ